MHPHDGGGWKNAHPASCHTANETEEQFIQFIEENAYSSMDIFLSQNNSFSVQPFFVNDWYLLAQLLEVDAGVISHDLSTLNISLNPDLSYYVRIVDPKLQTIIRNPYTIPRTLINLKQNAGRVQAYFKVIMLKYLTKILHICV